ncbi:MAG: LuxR C-terminal-related transcriptional regulator [Prevotella sp.]|nr:LuxR C-terminal-related transcriptional regulator [Prevotella sp.]MCI1780584.1 LuxR C-terminal-related transcriptional regulator [Prevotella sp.]MCI2138379.1 LuxR C-terminal-related transcriptional regulator [Prevotella sp.]
MRVADFRDNKKYEEISRELGISINTVKYHIKNALRQINISMAKYLFMFLFVIVLLGI